MKAAQREAVLNVLQCVQRNLTLGAAALLDYGLSETDMQRIRDVRFAVRGSLADLNTKPKS